MTSNTRLATALLFYGYKLCRPPCTRQVKRDGRTIVTFLFEPRGGALSMSCNEFGVVWQKLEVTDPSDATPEALRERCTWLAKLAKSTNPVEVAYANAGWRDIALSIVKATPRMIEMSEQGLSFIKEGATAKDISKLQQYI